MNILRNNYYSKRKKSLNLKLTQDIMLVSLALIQLYKWDVHLCLQDQFLLQAHNKPT